MSDADQARGRLRGVQAWPTLFFLRNWSEHAARGDRILSYLTAQQAGQQRPVASGIAEKMKSAIGLAEGGFDLLRDANDDLAALAAFISATVAGAAGVANDCRENAGDLAVTIVDSWYHITNAGGFHDAHFHHGCSWCGIYYVRVGEAGKRAGGGAPNGGSRFYCPLTCGGQYRDFGNRYLGGTLDMPIEDGLLVLFPSYLLHSGLPYQGQEDRVVIAFNARVHVRPGTTLAAHLATSHESR
jgi:uncharacterized protein (TIGR02466 family)